MVDDNITNLKYATDVLKQYYRISTAKSGSQALEFLKKARPDLILLDIKMPEMDGYETLKIIKENPRTVDIPVVFLTADLDRSNEIKGLKMGAMDYIRKPFEPDVMISRIDKILEIEALRKNLTITAQKDVLTNLWNRRYLEEKIAETRTLENPFGIFMILDLDNFKYVNDHFGHLMGDAVLVKFSEILNSVAGPDDAVCRIGGDEFTLFLRGEHSTNQIADLAENIIYKMREQLDGVLQDASMCSVSIGISMMPSDADNYNDLYNSADKALYYVKQNGKSGYHFYQEKEGGATHVATSTEAFGLQEFKQFIEEQKYEKGAYQVEEENFKNIYRFVKRYIGRTKQKVQVALLTMSGAGNDEKVLKTEMENMMKAVSFTLRRGDVGTQVSRLQYVVILMDTDRMNAEIVIKRVIDNYRQISDNPELTITFDIDSMIVD